MKNANQSISLGSNAMECHRSICTVDLRFFWLICSIFNCICSKTTAKCSCFFWDVDHFIFPLWLLWIKRKSSKMRDLMSSSNGTKCQFSFELFSFSLENTHTQIVHWNVLLHEWRWCICIRFSCYCILFSFDIFFFMYGLFFALSSPKYTTLFFFFTVYFTNIFRDSNTFCRFDGMVLL